MTHLLQSCSTEVSGQVWILIPLEGLLLDINAGEELDEAVERQMNLSWRSDVHQRIHKASIIPACKCWSIRATLQDNAAIDFQARLMQPPYL